MSPRRNAVSACERLDLLATKRDRNAAHHIRRRGPAQEILTEFHEHELVQIFLEVTADAEDGLQDAVLDMVVEGDLDVLENREL